jgi:nitrate reductase delta subunit
MDARLMRLYASLLEYPAPGLGELALECERAAGEAGGGRAGLGAFRAFAQERTLGEQEELYTRAFDLRAETSPYVGFHLYGEGYKRSLFMQELKRRYRRLGLETGRELPDHLSLLLRYASACTDPEELSVLVDEALLPALAKMIEADEAGETGCYRLLLAELRTSLLEG